MPWIGIFEVLYKGLAIPRCLSADGTNLLLTNGSDETDGKNEDIMLLDLTRKPLELVPVVATPANESDPRLSPDGMWLAYASNSSGREKIYLRFWHGEQRDWKVSSNGGSTPRWAPDGRALYYLDDVRLWAVPLEFSGASSAPRVVLGAPREVMKDISFAEADGYAIGRDGRVAKVELADWERAENHLEVVVGWLSELRRTLAGQ